MIRVGIIDSGIDGAARDHVVKRHCFATPGRKTLPDGVHDVLGHGSRVAAIIANAAPQCELFDARVFVTDLRCAATQVADAIDWLLEQRVHLINMSFGLRADRHVLRLACQRAVMQQVVLVAAAPARGAAVYPAAYADVLRCTGDARCARGEISHLDTTQADFGAHVRSLDDAVGGASMGCAHISAAIVAHLVTHPDHHLNQIVSALRESAAFRGAERRTERDIR